MKFEFTTGNCNLRHIFECGQCFRWNPNEDGSYTGIAGGHIAKVSLYPSELMTKGEARGGSVAFRAREEGKRESCSLSEDKILKESAKKLLVIEESNDTAEKSSEEFWRRYFDLDRDYAAIKKKLSDRDNTVRKAIAFGEGIRILRQEKWDTLVSFIISANNNIPRIKKNIEDIAEKFGEKAGEFEGKTYFNLPNYKVLASLQEKDLSECKLGYRARYLIETAKAVEKDQGRIDEENLLKYCGVGSKVANCIKLFSMEAYESFPIDTWVEQVMSKLYEIEGKKNIAKFAKETFGELGGFAQQYLFYYMRSKG